MSFKTKKSYQVTKPAPDGRLHTCGLKVIDGKPLKVYCRTADDVARLEAVQAYGYIVNEVRSTKKETGSKT
jgi:hypothetical protein